MSTPTFVGLTSMDTCDTVTNLGAFGTNSNKYGIDNEVYFEGTGAYVTKFNTVGLGGGGDQAVGTVDFTSNLFIGWCWYASWPMYDTFANGGVRVRLCDGTNWTANYKEWVVGGQDTPAVRAGGWRLVALDANRAADTGTASMTTVEYAGYAHLPNQTASQSPSFGMDNLWYGTEVEVTGPSFTDGTNGIDLNNNAGADTIDRNDGGSFITDGWETGDYVKVVGATNSADDGEYEITGVTASVLTLSTGDFTTGGTADTGVKIYCSVTFEDIVNWDEDETNNTSALRGVVTRDKGSGAFVINYPLRLGDASGGNSLYFRSAGDVVVCADQPLNTTRVNFIEVVEDTGETYVQFGGAGLPGSSIGSAETIFSTKSPAGLDFSATDVTEILHTGTAFSNLDAGIDLSNQSDHVYTGCTFTSCGVVDISGVTFTNATFIAAVGTTALTLALDGTGTTTLTGHEFNSAGTGHGIELTGTVEDVTLTDIDFNNYAATDGSTGNEAVYVNIASGSMTINVSGGTTPSIRTAGASVTVVSNPVTTLVNVKDETQSNEQNVRVFLQASDGTGDLPYEETVTSIVRQSPNTLATVTHTAHGLANNNYVNIEGANQWQYNGVKQISNVTTNTYDITLTSDPGSDATGTIIATGVVLSGLTDANGDISDSRSFTLAQPVTGWARKSSSTPYYRQANLNGTISTTTGLTFLVQLQRDD